LQISPSPACPTYINVMNLYTGEGFRVRPVSISINN
jgi:hypothetical protein